MFEGVRKMKWSETLHWITAISLTFGALSLLGAWLAGKGTFVGFTQQHLFTDATNLFLLSIATGVGTLIHQNLERK